VPNSQQLAERLRAHGRLYRHIAEQSWSETKAEELLGLADECTRAAEAAEAVAQKNKPDAA
jgi:hypothetical protein